MTEEIIRAITEAEALAAEEKRNAAAAASKIIEDARLACEEREKRALEENKAYREAQKKEAEASAEAAYIATLSVSEEKAKRYCSNALANARESVCEIVGRITSGDC